MSNIWHAELRKAVYELGFQKYKKAIAAVMIEMARDLRSMPNLEIENKNGTITSINTKELADKIKVNISSDGTNAVISMEDKNSDYLMRELASYRLNSNAFDKVYMKLQNNPDWLENMIKRLEE